MAKRQIRNIVVPISLWEHPDLTITEKHILVDIYSISDDNGVVVGPQALAAMCGLTQKEVKSILNSLYLKGALSISFDESGNKVLKAHIFNERYVQKVEVKKKEKPVAPASVLPYDEIQQKWAELCPKLPPIQRFTAQRKTKTRACLNGASATVDDLFKAFRIISVSEFLSGQKTNTWAASYDWLIKNPTNLTKVLEGQYNKDYNERRAYEDIIAGREPGANTNKEDIYR